VKQPVFLRIYLNGKLENVKQFTDEQVVIGKNADLQVSLTDDSISPVHAVIEERDTGYYISDLGSHLGTFRNGQKAFDEQLQSGDELQIGPYKIEFFIGVPKPTQAPKAEPVIPLEKPKTIPKAPPAPKAPAQEAPPPVSVKSKKSSEVKEQTDSFKMAMNSDSAKPGAMTELTKRMRASKGTIVEVVVAWGDRIVSSHHFKEKGVVTIGSDEKCTIVVPLVGLSRPVHTLLKLDAVVKVGLTHEMTGDYFKDEEHLSLSDLKRKNRIFQSADGLEFDLAPGESIRLGLHGDLLSIYVRYVTETPAPLVGPILDLTASESTAVLMSFVIAAIFGLYMLIYSPKGLDDESKIEEPIRKATITFNAPKKQIVQVQEESVPQEKKIVKVVEKVERTTTKPDPGKAAELRPSPQMKKTPIVSSTVQQGGTINTGKPAANAQSETRDVSKLGLLSTFGGKGTQNQLSKAYSGTGELLGDAAKATGYSGSNEDRAGENLGGRLKNVGAGGKGTATYGIAGVGTSGKGTGTYGGGTGGIGKRGRVDLNIGESEAEFTGSIDREAIRRVIRENLKLFENCYNQALRRNSDAYGKVEIQWNIEERGRATSTVVKSNSIGDRQMGECIARVIRGLTFPEPPPDQIAQVTYPFVFAAQ
jgi:pSer/pThr/pTyr-binding forkhead associated (FHA) protein